MPDDVSVFGGIARSGPALSLKELHIQYPVQLIFNSPTAALCLQNLTCRHSFAAVNEIMRLLWDVSILFNYRKFPVDKPASLWYHTTRASSR